MQGLPHLLDLADTFIAQLKSQLQQAAQEKAALEARVAELEAEAKKKPARKR